MNTSKQAHQKLHQLRSRANQLKASLHNHAVHSLNRLVSGQSILHAGQVIRSPGGTFSYEVIGPCCRLFDRGTLPWPSCSLRWHGKQPSWRRIGRRFVVDMATKRYPSYSVRLLGQDYETRPQNLTLYWLPLTAKEQEWWYSRKPQSIVAALSKQSPSPAPSSARLSGCLVVAA